ncbi:MAG: hypothetical protein GY765_29680 [bacterium]|nr:hypothetical protein [bacterium]
MVKKVVMVVVACLLFVNWSMTVSCGFTPDPDQHVDLDIPYHQQECWYYCGVACIQMWAHGCNTLFSQTEIAGYLDVIPPGINPYDLADGVANFTHHEGYLGIIPSSVHGAEGDLIGATVSGIKEGIPSIMPFYSDHAVLIKGYKWREVEVKDEQGYLIGYRPVALNVHYHDPDGMPNQKISASTLETLYEPAPFAYWAILGRSYFLEEGIVGHNEFIRRRGSYYGGPRKYEPRKYL